MALPSLNVFFSLQLIVLLVFMAGTSHMCSAAQPAPVTSALLAPITYDPSTSLYSVRPLIDAAANQFAPPRLLLDLEANNLWRDCLNDSSFDYHSPTLKPVLCGSSLCSALIRSAALGLCDDPCYGPASPICGNQTCSLLILNSAINSGAFGKVWTDTISVRATSADGKNPGSPLRVPDFAFVCRDDLLLQNHGVPSGVVGVAGLGKASLGLPTQLAAALHIKRRFAYCLPSTPRADGVLFFGESPYIFLGPGMDFSKSLRYTPLLKAKQDPYTYFIGVESISVDGTKLPLNYTDLFSLKYEEGLVKGGARITSTTRYTQLEPSIYKALAAAFKTAAKARGIREAAPVSPFDTCFDASSASSTRVGYAVPEIDLGLPGGAVWPWFGANSVVSLSNGRVICLAFTPTAELQRSSVVVGTFQQQDALLQFDLGKSRMGIVPTLLGSSTTCSNFNFTSAN